MIKYPPQEYRRAFQIVANFIENFIVYDDNDKYYCMSYLKFDGEYPHFEVEYVEETDKMDYDAWARGEE